MPERLPAPLQPPPVVPPQLLAVPRQAVRGCRSLETHLGLGSSVLPDSIGALRSAVSSSCRGGLACLGKLVVLGLSDGGGLGAVHVEPPVADEVVLVEDGAVGAEEGELGGLGAADVENLAFRLLVSVVTWRGDGDELRREGGLLIMYLL